MNQATSEETAAVESAVALPAYMTEVYDWAYVNPRYVRWLDRNIVVRVLLFANDQRLMRAYLEQIRPGSRVWQVAHVYGDLVKRAADKVGDKGLFQLTDVTPIQIEHAEKKLADRPWARVTHSDAAHWVGQIYDLVCSFFLLHEVPEQKKREVVDRMLASVEQDGKVVFVDYHRPRPWQPIGWILRFVNAKLEPFAESTWMHEIREYASQPERFSWKKRTFFGGVYQIVVAKPIVSGK